MFGVDWRALFVPSGSLLEIFLRGSVMYLALFVMMRLILKRETGGISITDILVVVLIADAAQNGLAGQYHSITEGLLLVATILGWSYVLDWLGFKVPRFQRLLEPRPILLVTDGRMLPENMEKELITESELMSKLREQGIEDITRVKRARMEGDGQISIITKDDDTHRKPDQRTF